MGGVFYRHELEALSRDLTDLGAEPLTDARLIEAIDLYNANRAAVDRLYELRRVEPWRVPTHELYPVLRAGMVLPVEEHTVMLEV
jgi:benzoyl-CoA reductase subunit C